MGGRGQSIREGGVGKSYMLTKDQSIINRLKFNPTTSMCRYFL